MNLQISFRPSSTPKYRLALSNNVVGTDLFVVVINKNRVTKYTLLFTNAFCHKGVGGLFVFLSEHIDIPYSF